MKPIFKLENQTTPPYQYDKTTHSYINYDEIKENRFNIKLLIQSSIDNFFTIKELSKKMKIETDKEKYHNLKINHDKIKEKLIKKLKIFKTWYIKRRIIHIFLMKLPIFDIDISSNYLYYLINNINQSSINDYLNKLFNDIISFYNKSNQYELLEYLRNKSYNTIQSIDLSILNNKFNEYKDLIYKKTINKKIDKRRGEI